MRSSNPMQRDSIYGDSYIVSDKPMTMVGTANKLFLLSLIMILGAGYTYYMFMQSRTDLVNTMMLFSIGISFILALVLSFKPKFTPYLGPVYALCQGIFVSGISCSFESLYKGIVMQAASLTLLTVMVMAMLYSTGIIKATEKLRGIVFAASTTIFIFYLISFVLMLFGINVPYFSQNTPLNIAINVAIACVAAMFLIFDFDFIKTGVQRGVPAYFEWYGAFSLLVTVVWLYIEILRLLSRLKDR